MQVMVSTSRGAEMISYKHKKITVMPTLYHFFGISTLYQILSSIYVIDMTLTQTLMKIYCNTLQLKFINKSFMTKKMWSFYSALLLIRSRCRRQSQQCVMLLIQYTPFYQNPHNNQLISTFPNIKIVLNHLLAPIQIN